MARSGGHDETGHPDVADVLEEGERRVDEVRVGDARVVLTDRRLVVFREAVSPSIRAVDRVNLGDVNNRTKSTPGHLLSAVQWAILGGFLLAAWRLVPFGALVRPVDPPEGTGFGELFEAVNTIVRLMAFLDEAFLAAGVLALAWGAVRVGRYLYGRTRVLEVTVAGEEPITFTDDVGNESMERLRTLVRQAKPSAAEKSDEREV